MSVLTAWNAAAGAVITEPGIYDLPTDVYLADPVKGGSLSSSGARKLLPPSCPALFRYEQDNPRTPTDEMLFGSAWHKLALGAGAEVTLVEADSWRTKAAREAKAEALAAGRIPTLWDDHTKASRMVTALRKHEYAGPLLDEARGKAEQTLVWQDRETGIMCRALVDFLPNVVDGRRLVAADLKSCPSAERSKVERTVWDLGYHIQAAWYLDGMAALGLDPRPALLFIFQERSAPFLINVTELSALALEAGLYYCRKARRIYAECAAAERWPSYCDGIDLISLPPWGQTQYFQESDQ